MEFRSEAGKELLKKYDYLNLRDCSPPTPTEIYNSQKVSLDDVYKLFSMQGVVGEESLVKSLVCASISKKSFGVLGPSGSGKTFITDKLIDIIPKTYILSQASGVAAFYDSKNINNSNFLYIPELQKAITKKDLSLIELIKDVTENKDASRIITNSTRDGTTSQTINRNISVIYTLANENSFKTDIELDRRLIKFYTDNSETQKKNIFMAKANELVSGSVDKIKLEGLRARVQNHIEDCFDNYLEVKDPFIPTIYEQLYSSNANLNKAEIYRFLVKGYVNFNSNNNIKTTIDDKSYLLVNKQDHLDVQKFYGIDINLNNKTEFEKIKGIIKEIAPKAYDSWLLKQIL